MRPLVRLVTLGNTHVAIRNGTVHLFFQVITAEVMVMPNMIRVSWSLSKLRFWQAYGVGDRFPAQAML